MAKFPWRCEHPDGDVKFAAKQDHKEKLEADGYVCVVYPDNDWDTLTPGAPTNKPLTNDD